MEMFHLQSKAIPSKTTKGGRAQNKNPEYLPSPAAERVAPRIDEALKEKIAKATKPKGEAGKRGVSNSDIEEHFFDDFRVRQFHTFSKSILQFRNNKGFPCISNPRCAPRLYTVTRQPKILPVTSKNLLKLVKFARFIL